tara:strand:+ start:4199 stop:4534 length:336 start_codon:yes stop_codon:yes gene_type:complete
MPKAKEYPVYNKGDLVVVNRQYPARAWHGSMPAHQKAEMAASYGIIVGRTVTWRGAYELSKDTVNKMQLPLFEEGKPKRFWDDARYSPYRVMMCSTGELEWVSAEDMKWIS